MTRRGPTGSRRQSPKGASSPGADWRGEDPNLELEKSRYADPIASRELLLKHLAEAPEPLTAARLAKRLGLNSAAQREALAKRLAAMVRDGQAIEGPNGFATAGEGERVAGRVRGRSNGDVLVLPDDGSAPLVLARADTATLMHGDRVEVLAVGMNERGRRIARLIRRVGDAPPRIGGIWHASQDRGRVEPEDPGHWYSVEVGVRDRHGARDGDNVVVEVTKRPQGDSPAHGRIVEVLHDLRPSDLAARFAILRHDLPQEFPPEVVHAANRFAPDVLESDRIGREDLRELPLVTIDGEDAKDFDDAVYAEALRGGGWRLVVAIADVSNYVRYGSELDTEARSRATSVYFPDRVIPMLPEHLSNHLCSLMPKVERLAFVCDMRVSKTGKLSKSRFYEAVIRSHARLTYDQAWKYLENPQGSAAGDLSPDILTSLDMLYAIYGTLKFARDARGALDFRGGEVKARIGGDGRIEGFYAVTRNDAHRLIEECMIAANVEAAVALRIAKAGSLYRVHGQPEDKRVTELQKVLNALQVGAVFSEKPTPREFRQMVDKLSARPDGLLLESLVIRSLAQAVYQQTNIGHFGLALEEYAHFTSPIRRYPDLLVHRAIKAAVLPGSQSGRRYSTAELQTLGAESSQRERRADDASRDVMGYLKCLYLQPRVGETFDAVITSALEFGLFVQLKEMPIDGLVHISAIPGDYWELEDGGMGLVGQRTGRRWQMGDPVRVRLSRVDLTQRQIDFELLDAEGSVGQGTVRAPRRGAGAAEPTIARGATRGEDRRAARRPGTADAVAESAADAAGVGDSKRNFVYGLHAIHAVLERSPERLLELWMAQPRDDSRSRDLRARAEDAGIRVQTLNAEGLAKLVGEVAHQGAVAAVRPLKPWDEHDLLDALSQLGEDPLLLVLDGVTDPHNLGACLRTADAAGAHAVIIPKDRAAAVDGVVRKVAAGAAEFIPVASVTNLARALDGLKERGIWVVGTDGEAEQTLYRADLKRPLALVLGAEGSGMRRLTRERCDFLVRIPMAGHMESLNVSVAAGVVLFEARRQRG